MQVELLCQVGQASKLWQQAAPCAALKTQNALNISKHICQHSPEDPEYGQRQTKAIRHETQS